MLSYRHAFHAGNHADVLKHLVFGEVLQYFNQKDKPYWVIDTHAGAGLYHFDDEISYKKDEFSTGIARLLTRPSLNKPLRDYCDMVLTFNSTQALNTYPGSPSIAQHYLRPTDKLRLFELHTSDFEQLQQHFARHKRQVKTEKKDGYQGLKSLLPPASKRGVILIDPSYELKTDYEAVVNSIQDSLKRFATGTYLIWYPLLPREEPKQMFEGLLSLDLPSWLNVTLSVEAPSPDFGMYGSGMLVINPPWILPKTLDAAMPALTELLALDDAANFTLDYRID